MLSGQKDLKSMLKDQILGTAFCRETHNVLYVLQMCVQFNKKKIFKKKSFLSRTKVLSLDSTVIFFVKHDVFLNETFVFFLNPNH